MTEGQGDRLVNEAIKRILLDIVVRGHGDRLIGRWSREPELQTFLEQVPYMLDRINQLHLACTRLEPLDSEHIHHHHHNHHFNALTGRSSFNDFVNLIGTDRHWLVRTRDPLGLTPLHKAVLYKNRPIVEYILDRYADEPAAINHKSSNLQQCRVSSHESMRAQYLLQQGATRLVDGQDKYGRTALHYAAAYMNTSTQNGISTSSHLYHFLLYKGASQKVRDFRGKTASHYVKHPNQLRSKSIVRLANKLNANYQANVLTKTLRASSNRAPIGGSSLDNKPDNHRLSMSVSCTDISSNCSPENRSQKESKSQPLGRQLPLDKRKSQSSMINADDSASIDLCTNGPSENGDYTPNQVTIDTELNNSIPLLGSSNSIELSHLQGRLTPETSSLCSDHSEGHCSDAELVQRQLVSDRCPKQILDQRSQQVIQKHLKEGMIEKINELLIEGHGEFMLRESPVFCWNQHCKRYLSNVVPSLLVKLDKLHEFIATNQSLPLRTMLSKDPILVRMRRPYRRAAMGAIHIAVHHDRRSIVKYLLERYPELVKQTDSLGATCLHWAAKSLRHDKLYAWLLEHHGSQLEQVRDIRNKSAFDYRQQAIRLSSFGRNHPIQRRPFKGATELMNETQAISNNLQFTGTRSNMNSRRGVDRIGFGSRSIVKSDVEQQTRGQLDKSIEIGIESPCDSPLEIGEDALQPDDDAFFGKSPINLSGFELPRRISSAIDKGSRNGIIEEARRFSDSFSIRSLKSESQDVPNLVPLAETTNDKSQVSFLAEMGHLEPEYVDEKHINKQDRLEKHYEQFDSPSSSPSSLLVRPGSASTVQDLETTMRECLLGDDFKKLEHVVLAGCGQRLLAVYARLESNSSNTFPMEAGVISGRMHEFIRKHVSECMKTMEQIHKVLHKCFIPTQPNKLWPDENATFHKLCNLLGCRRFIMSRDLFGACPLHIALMRSDRRLVEYLLRRHPEAVSAPDHESRNALHYAALTLAAYENHGPFKLTISCETVDQTGFWLVDEIAKTIFENLCARYSSLLELKDRKGFTCLDYLKEAKNFHQNNVKDLTKEVVSPKEWASCCPDYAKLLERYNYSIISASFEFGNEDEQTMSYNLINSMSEPVVLRLPIEGDETRERFNQLAQSEQVTSETIKSTEDLVLHLDGELSASVNPVPLESACFSRPDFALEEPISAKEDEFPVHSSKVKAKEIEEKKVSTNKVKDPFALRAEAPVVRIKQQRKPRPLLECLQRTDRANSGNLFDVSISDQQQQQKHHHQHHRANQYLNKRTSLGRASIVGGVIVPTIIHNDKMDEIETYDIIYRQPPSNRTAGSSSSSEDDQRCSSDSEQEDDRVERLSNEFEDRVRREKSELKAKVDQIMCDIKVSSESGKHPKPSGSSERVHFTLGDSMLTEQTNPKVLSSLSSSGASSASSASSTCTSISSKTLSCSRSSNSSSILRAPSGSSSSPTSSNSSSSSTCSTTINSRLQKVEQLEQLQKVSTNKQPKNLSTSISDIANLMISKNTFGQTYLHFIASRAQNCTTLYKILNHGSYLIGERDAFYRTPRDIAVQFNLPNNVQVLDKFIIDLFIVANTSLLRHLLNQGYSPLIHVADPDGNDIMLILKLLKLDRMVHCLLQMADFQRWRDELHTFIRHGYSAGVSELIRKHSDLVRAKSVYSRTSLHLAILFDRLEMVNELLEADPNSVHITDNMGRTALHYSYGMHSTNSEAIRDRLLASGSSLEMRDVRMRMPKYYYIFKREIEQLRRLELELN